MKKRMAGLVRNFLKNSTVRFLCHIRNLNKIRNVLALETTVVSSEGETA